MIHYVLERLEFTPHDLIFPISAAILRDTKAYDKVLESYSEPLLRLITHYTVNEAGEMHVKQPTVDFYRYSDLTIAAEYLFSCVETTILTDFREELDFLTNYDSIKKKIQQIVDMPDRKIDIFIKCIRQNEGKLSAKKRMRFFPMLTDQEIQKLENSINLKP